MQTFHFPLSLFILTLFVSIGCSKGETAPETFPVSGTVTYQGQPLKSGRIGFVPKGDGLNVGPPSACEIVDGAFEGKATSGAKKVEIYGSWDSDKTEVSEDGVTQIPVVESVPDKYNEFSTLEAEIVSGPNDGLTFDLK